MPQDNNDLSDHPHWDDYANSAQAYLDRPIFNGTPLTGQMFADAAKNTFLQTGKYIPPQFALAQAQLESKMGLNSRHAASNPFNVGEFDSGTTQQFNTPQDGVNAYYNTVAKDYLTGNVTTDDLTHNYVNYNGDRYASNPNYEQKMRQQMNYIGDYLSNNSPSDASGTPPQD